ncbi:hypothetical protein L204_105280 [Cryptococcus depauperatus]
MVYPCAYVGVLVLAASSLWQSVRAEYLSVNMTSATQCGISTVRWEGDDGPYHLLLTPTDIKEHGYNVWIESIPAGTNSYNLTVRQPAGLQFLLTMWGASGISSAGTTDVMTVGASNKGDSSCFLSDDQILSLYSFSFNLSAVNDNNYPPQCSNISLSWPTSLESNVTSDIKRNAAVGDEIELNMKEFEEMATSSSDHSGNTTKPPTMFGIIPLGNSFSIPITFDKDSKFAKYLPETSLSDNPTTFISYGTTYLNWTVNMAKGTRFILVAGIGSEEEWASGGSSKMFTVGQGSLSCVGNKNNGNGAPSVTASNTAPTNTNPAQDQSATPFRSSNGLFRTIVAVVCSIVGTLVIVGAIFYYCRLKNHHATGTALVMNGSNGNGRVAKKNPFNIFGINRIAPVPTKRGSTSENQLDLIPSRESRRNHEQEREISPLVSYNQPIVNSPSVSSPLGALNPFRDSEVIGPNFVLSPQTTSRSTTFDSGFAGLGAGEAYGEVGSRRTSLGHKAGAEAGSGANERREGVDNGTPRHSSMDALLPDGATSGIICAHDPHPALRHRDSGTYTKAGAERAVGRYYSTTEHPIPPTRRVGPLVLHGPTSLDVDSSTDDDQDGQRQTSGEGQNEEAVDLKRETLAISQRRRLAGPISGAPGPGRCRRVPQQHAPEPEYMIHRDAGRIVAPERPNVFELPPRYEEVNWTEEERRAREGQGRDGQGTE